MPKLSVIIANYNYGRFLEEAIQSVLGQDLGDAVEVILCDGGSTDNSVDIIRKYANGLPPNTNFTDWYKVRNGGLQQEQCGSQLITWWCSEKDGGQSAAFNKGFSHARGEWLTWLNADDLLLPGVLRDFEKLVSKNKSAQWVTGNKVHFDSASGRIIQVYWGPHSQPPLLAKRHAFSAVFGPTTFFRRNTYELIGPIDEHLHYVMDSAYWALFTMKGIRQTRLNRICWACRVHEASKTWGDQTESAREKRTRETKLWRKETGYSFQVSYLNVWYLLWLLWRVVDGSMLKRLIVKKRLTNKTLKEYYDSRNFR